jgi:hypothetical protein
MTTTTSSELPGTIGPLIFALASGLAVPALMSDSPSGVKGGLLLVAVLAGVVLSTRYSVLTWRRLARHEFQLAHAVRWVMVTMALMVNGFVCFLLAGMVLLVLGILITGKGVAG